MDVNLTSLGNGAAKPAPYAQLHRSVRHPRSDRRGSQLARALRTTVAPHLVKIETSSGSSTPEPIVTMWETRSGYRDARDLALWPTPQCPTRARRRPPIEYSRSMTPTIRSSKLSPHPELNRIPL